ncbi:MAG: Ig-like domain-containing protein [Aliishimia sp.]
MTAENLDSLRIAIETASQGTQGLTSTTELLEVIAEQVSLGGGGDGGASQPFSETEALAAIQEFLSANGPGDRDEMISAIGTLFPNADVSTPYAYEFGLRSGMYADRTNPTTSEIQTIVENVPNILNSALAELAEDIAGDANGMPFGGFEVYLLSPGDTLQIDYAAGLLDGTLYADPGNPTLAEVQDQIVAQSEAYVETQLQALADLIAGGDASAFDPQPYVNFAPEFGQYIFNNIPDFRDALIDPSNYADPSQPTIAEIVAISAEIKSIGVANTLAEIAEDIAGNSNGQLVMVSDLFAISYPFNNGNSDQFVQSIIDPTHYADPANPTEEEVTAAIQASSTAVGLVLTKLTSVIAGTTPTSDFSVEDLTALTTGVEPDKMDDYLAAVLDPVTPWYGTPNAYQISDLVIQVNAGTYGSNSGGPNPGGPGSSGIDAVLAALAEDIAGNADNNHVASWQLTQAGFEYLSNDYWNDYQAELLDSNNYADAENPTEEEVQAVIFAVNEVILVSILPTLATELASDYPNSGILRTFSEIVEGSAPEFEAQYSNVIFDSNNYADIAAPTAAEVRAVLQTVNSAMDRILASVTATLIDGEPQGTISLADMQAVTAHAPPESLQAFTDRVFATTNYNLDSPGYILGDFAIATTVSNVDVAFRGLAEIALRTSGDPAAMDHFNEVSFDFALLRAGLVNEVTDFEGWYATMVLDPSHYSDPNAPTFVEVQAVIDTGNQVLAPIFDRIMDVLNGNADASTFALADLQALSDQVTAENADFYREQIFDADRYNGNLEQYVFHRVMDGTTAVDTALDALDELAASINQIDGAAFNYGNDLAPVLARIDNSLQYAYEGILRNEGNYVDTLHPTLAEAQAAIDHFNSMPAVVAEIQEDVAGNANGNLVSLAQLQSVSPEINADWLSEYQTTLASGNYYLSGGGSDSYNSLFDAIDQVNETQALAALADDLTQQVSTGFTGDFVRMAAENTDPDLLSSYLTALHDGTNFADTANPTAAEVQAIVDQVNAQLVQASLIEDMSGNQDGMHLEADQLQRVIDNAQTANLDLYLDALADPAQYADANAPLVSEMQAVVDDINLEVSQDQQLTVLGYHFTGPDATSFLYRFDQTNLEDLVPGLANDFRENYLSRILDETNYADPANPTLAEVQGLIDAANAEIDAVVAELFEDHDGNANAELVTAAQLSVLSDTINPDDLSYHQAAIDSYIAAVTPETVDLEHVVNIIRGVDQDRDAYRASMIELVEDIAGNQNAVPVTISDLRNLADNAGLYKTLVNNSWAGTIMPALIDASNYADPAAPTDQEIHTIVDTQITQAFIADLPNQVSPSDLPFQVLRQKFSILDLDGFSQFVTSPYNNSYDSGLNDSIQAQVYLSHNYADPDSPTLDEIEAATLLGWRNFVYAEVVDAGTAELDTWHALGLTNLTADTLAAFETEFFGLYTKTIEIAQDKADFYTALYALADGTANAGTALNADTVTTDVFGAAYNPQNWSADLTAQATIPTLLNDIYDRLDFDAVDTKAERSDWATAIWSKSFSVDQYQALGFADVTAGNLGELNTRVFRLPPSEPGGSNVYVDVFGNPNIPYPETTHVPTIAGITDDLAAVLDPITVDISADSTTLAQDYGTYTVTFSEAVTGFGLEDIMVNLQDLNPSYTLSDFTAVDGSTYTFRINDMFGFDGNTTVWLDVDGMSGSEGQGILGSERTHTISVTEEIRVISTSVDGSGDLQAGDDIVLNFNDYMATANISGTIESSIYLTDVTSGTTTVYEASDRFGSIQSDEIDISGSTLTINPVGDLIVGHNYTLSLGAHAIQGDQNDAIQTPVNTYDEDAGIYDYQLSFAVI